MKDKTIKIDLSKIANTALQEKVDKELEKVLENILDLNTEAKTTREEFNIMLQSMFIDDADRNLVLDFASHLKIEKGAEVQDNGISQMATVRDGVASLAQAKTPNPVTLRPYRTFNEVEQPASQFIFRINKLANLALFEADGGKWKLEAVESIANYLKNELASNEKITILA